MPHFLFDAYHPVIGKHWRIDAQEMHEFIEAGFRMDYARQKELYEKWQLANDRPPAPKPKIEAKPAPVKRRMAYGMS